MRNKRIVILLAVIVIVLPAMFVVDQAVRTLRTLTTVERERDTWQRPDEILQQLGLNAGNTVVDLGAGAGYFSLKIAPRVTPDGRVLALDLRRESLAFLWIRAMLAGHPNLHVIRNEADDLKLPPGPIDAVLIANTYHELTAPEAVLSALFESMRSGARLVVVDRAARDSGQVRWPASEHHEITPAAAERDINRQGFHTVVRDDRLIDRAADDDIWWLIVFRKP